MCEVEMWEMAPVVNFLSGSLAAAAQLLHFTIRALLFLPKATLSMASQLVDF